MKFERVLSLGQACDTAYQIRLNYQQTEAYPFDWLITPFDSLCQIIQADFTYLTSPEYMVSRETYVENTLYKCRFLHDFPDHKLNADTIDSVSSKYSRRVDRWRRLIRFGGPILFVGGQQYVDGDVIGLEKAKLLESLISQTYPHLDFSLLVQNPTGAEIAEQRSGRVTLRQLRAPSPFVWSGDDQAWADLFASIG